MNKKIFLPFIFITFSISWLLFFLAAFLPDKIKIIPMIIGTFAPLIAAVFVYSKFGSIEEKKQFKARVFKWKNKLFWYVIPIFIILCYHTISTYLDFRINTIDIALSELKSFYMIIPMVLLMIIGGGQEEIGWRGLALPELLKSYSHIASSFIIGFIWAIWHLPLFFIPGTSQYGTSLLSFALGCCSISIIMTWIYVRTKSTLLCYWYHMLHNGITGFFAVYLYPPTETISTGLFSISFTTLVSEGLIILLGVILLKSMNSGFQLKKLTQ